MNVIRIIALAVVGLFVGREAFAAAYYVDDGITNGNVYTTAAGNDANPGTTPATPKRTITNLLETITLSAGDIVYIDTGVYSNYTVTITNSGVLGNPIIFQGSTNVVAGGTLITRNNSGLDVIGLRGNHLLFRNMTIANGIRGFNGSLQFPPPVGVVMEHVTVRNNNVALQRGQWTIRQSLFLNNTTLRDPNSSSFEFNQCVFWGHTVDAQNVAAAITINNSVYVGGDLQASMTGDYNVFWDVRLLNQNRAYLYEHNMPNSTFADPQFANPGATNFFPASVSGRFNPATGLFVTDAVHSVLIDFGDLASTAWTNETSPNGGRVNAGASGGTALASRSRTNAWLFALTFNDGGAVTGTTQLLVWNHGNFTNGSTVRLQYSADHGGSWSNIVTGIAVTNRSYTWNVTGFPANDYFWRVVSEANTNVAAQSRQQFVIGNERVPFYLNDPSTADGFYTTAAGSDANDGLTPATPKLTLTNLLATYTLGRHDIIYIDTGIYSNYTAEFRRYGVEGQPLIVQGAPRDGATRFRRGANATIFQMVGSHHLIRNITFEGGGANGAINDGVVTIENSVFRTNIVAFRRGVMTIRNTALISNTTVIVSDTGSFAFDQCVFWRNGQIQSTLRPWSASNSVFHGGFINSLGQVTGGDYCLFWGVNFDGYPHLSELQRLSGQWAYSSVLDPLFESPETGRFYAQSLTGRYNPDTSSFVTDTNHSPAIDFGDPASTAWTNETSPNGSRLNAGLFGGTAFASRSRTNAWLQALSFNDGGQLNVPGEQVRWSAGNLPTGSTVRIEFSFNSGFSWNVFQTNVSAAAGVVTINNTNFSSSRIARWRVVLEANPAVTSTNRADFTYRSGVYTYYVNDESLAGDVFTVAPGNDANFGTTPDSPRATLSAILTNFSLGPGDMVYVDTGVYQSSATIPVTLLVSGTSGAPVVVQGSTNRVAGGTVLRGPPAGLNGIGLTFSAGVQDVELRDLVIQRRTTGISLNNNTRILLHGLRVESNSQAGVSATGVTNLLIRGSTIRANALDGLSVSAAGDVAVLHSAIWLNDANAISTLGGRVFVTNSVLSARGSGRNIYSAPALTNIVANYNLLRVEDNASAATVNVLDRSLNTLSAWQAESGMDRQSLDDNPHFVNADGGDFHLRSQTIQGRYDPLLGWVTDTITSPLIDAGDPTFPFSGESAPNGSRVNIGIYGNTEEASRADFGRLFAGNLHQGGFVRGTSVLHWVAAGLPPGQLVNVDVSLNAGETWMTLATGVLASAEQLAWNTTTNAAAVAGLWRVRAANNPAIASQTTNFFGIRNASLTYYVNDEATDFDVFSAGPGSMTNWVASATRPLDSLARIFQRYDLEPGDRVLVDWGTYTLTNTMTIGARHNGAPTSGVVSIIGAATCPDGVTPAAELVGLGSISQTGIQIDRSRYMVISNVAVRQTGTALSINRGDNIQLDGLRLTQTATNAVVVLLSTNIEFRRTLIKGSSSYGWVGLTNTATRLVNSMVVSNRFGGIQVGGGSLGVTNSVLIVDEPGLAIFTVTGNGLVRSDYNNLRVNSLANIARYNGRLHKYPATWQLETTNDLRSLSHDPGFINALSGDYHLTSTGGRLNGTTCGVVTDLVDSVMIDAGSPVSGAGAEPSPNGGRINLGLFGGSAEASRSPAAGRLLPLTLNSGGTFRGTNTLYWLATQTVTGHQVYIDVSFDNGVTWTNIATNQSASAGAFLWDASAYLSSALGRWRIGSQTDPLLVSTTEVAFTLNNGSIGYYVNDASTNGDVYATAAGTPSNDGLSADTPVTSIESIFGRYQPGPGDIIYVDTGAYQFNATISLDANYSGQVTNPVVIQGSTNWTAGGSVINMNKQGPLFQLANVNALTFNDLILTNARYGFNTLVSSNLVFNRVIVAGAGGIIDAGSLVMSGFRFDGSSDIQLDRVAVAGFTNRSDSAGILIRQALSGGQIFPGRLSVRSSVLWSNAFGIWAQSPAPVSITNSVIYVAGENGIGMRYNDADQFRADYNNYRMDAGARLAELRVTIASNFPSISKPIYFTSMQAWREYTGQDTNTLTYYPNFANPSALDFSLKSAGGRWTPSGLVTDEVAVSSALIDSGDPAVAFTNEPSPNGGRINLGVQGNTGRASLSPTNLSLVLLNLHDGGVARGSNVLLRWGLRGDFTGKTLIIQLSTNGGSTYVAITNAVPAGQLQYVWDTTAWESGFNRKWRLVCEEEPGITAASEKSFVIRNTNFAFYVNDESVEGDLYTTAAGNGAFSGTSPARPLSQVQEVLAAYTLVGGDTVYVDTGVYNMPGDITITPRDYFAFPGVIALVGSTNESAGGSTMLNGGFRFRDARDVAISDFTLAGTLNAGISVNSSTNIRTERIAIRGAGHGIYLQNGVDVNFRGTTILGSITNGIQLFDQNRRVVFEHGVIWTNRRFAVNPVANIAISNSVLAASGSGKYIFDGASNAVFNLDHNLYYTTNGARLARLSFGLEPFPREFANLAAWRAMFGSDAGSLAGDPLFANPAAFDFHPRSTGGRWLPAASNFVVDTQTSPLVDAGNPVAAFDQEPEPNGARVNIGLYGNRIFASKSPAAPDYLLVRLDDGGSVSGTNVILSWVARGAATGHAAKVEVSVDGGLSWSVLASNVSPPTAQVSWNTTSLASTVVGLWRVSSEVAPSVTATSRQFFSIRNGPVSFYVNDLSTTGDVYCVTNGSITATGTSPQSPLNSIQTLLSRYDMEPGDVIYMDTGIYTNFATIQVDQLDAGVRLRGSTNVVGGGTLLEFAGPTFGMQVIEAPGTVVEHLKFGAIATAIQVDNAAGVTLQHLDISGAGTAVDVARSTGVIIRNSSMRNGQLGIAASANSSLDLDHLVLFSNSLSSVRLFLSSASLENSVISVFGGPDRFGIDLDAGSVWNSDYNFFELSGEAVLARRLVTGSAFDLRWRSASTWSRDTDQDRHSLTGEPLFADRNVGDFHPRSAAGRYSMLTGTFVNDSQTSPLIDAGSPLTPYEGETGANGVRANIGMHGNTIQASRSPTNSRLQVVRLNDGGRAEGSLVPLTWVATGAATGHTLRLDASFNNGAAWSVIQSNVPANAEILFWDSGTNAAWFGRWRVTSEQQPSVSATNLVPFAVRNATLSLYVNDSSSAGDIYTSASGDPANSGISPGQPRHSLQTLIDDYDLEPGDTIYVDTGEYILGSAIRLGRYDAWNEMANLLPLQNGGRSVRIIGNTNDTVQGTRFIRAGTGNALELREALGVHLSHLDIQHAVTGGGISIDVQDSPYSFIEWCRTRYGTKGVSLLRSTKTRMHHLLARSATQQGIQVRDSTGVDLWQSLLWSNAVGLVSENKAVVSARNNAVVALAPDHVGWQRNDGPLVENVGVLDSNYNLLWATNGAFIAELAGNQYPGGRRRFERMANWADVTGLDLQSLKSDPQFVAPNSGDFHPYSPFGRYQPGVGYVTNDWEPFSPLIDTGDPALSFARERNPNGQRANIGLYGNSSFSSLSPAAGSLQTLTFRDGGASSGEITLRWSASGPAASHLVTLQFSSDGGATWTNIASNVVASTQSYTWDSEPYGRAAAGLWQLFSQTDTNILSRTERFFALRQGGSIPYYVNDSSLAGDVYCTAPGNEANNGFLPATPKASLQGLLDEIDLEPGDVVYMDTGTYSVNLNVTWGELDGGSTTNPVILRGSTNFFVGGTVMDRLTGLGSALLVSRLEGLTIENVTFINGSYGLSAELSQQLVLRNITARNNTRSGLRIAGSVPVRLENSILWNNPTNAIEISLFSIQLPQETLTQFGHLEMVNNTVWGSRYGLAVNNGGSAELRNNLIRVNGADSRVYYLALGVTNIVADYNAYYRENGAIMAEQLVAFGGNEYITRLIDWQRIQGNDLHSLSHDPRVADPGLGDFHLISAAGRVLPSGAVTNDPPGIFSPLIDTGDPGSVFTNEPSPNGARINIGRYGNTHDASRSRSTGWLLALTLNDGGRISGTNIIRWAAGNWPTSATVRIEFAYNGVDFAVVATNVPVYEGEYVWDATPVDPPTALARWRVVNEADPSIASAVQTPFVIKNNPLIVFVNDGSTEGDVYTSAIGNNTNNGSASSPLEDPGVALERFPFSEGDVMYIDTGSYISTNPAGLRIGLLGDTLKAGVSGDPIRIIGSTNGVKGGTLIESLTNYPYGLLVNNTAFISIEHLAFAGFSNGVRLVGSEGISLNNVRTFKNTIGMVVDNVISTRFDRCASWQNSTYGLSVDGAFSSVNWNQGVIWSNRLVGVRHVYGPLAISNSVIAAATNSLLYEINSAFAQSRGDFNLYDRNGNTNLMRDIVGGVTYRNVRTWQRARGMDTNSFVADPKFADPGNGDFHLRSEQGRYFPNGNTFLIDGDTSWGIDAGAVSHTYNQESPPNGLRLNIGLHGNTAEASRSSTNRALFVVSLRDGGTAASPQPLIWLTRGMTTGDTVRIEYTENDGIDWVVLATNLPALSRTYDWYNELLESTPLARWRVILEQDELVNDITETVFKVRNGSIPYYVNDNNVLGDVFTAGPGMEINNGITVSSPVHSVEAIIDRFELEGGDIVYIDTGYYEVTNNIVIRSDDSGLTTNRVIIQGSTNRLAGGTRFFRTLEIPWSPDIENTNAVFELLRVRSMEFRNLVLENANIGFYVNNSLPQVDQLYFRDLEIRDGGYFGMRIAGSFGNVLDRVLIHRMSGKGLSVAAGSVTIQSSVMWSNHNGAVEGSATTFYLTNNVLHAFGSVTNAALSVAESIVQADYNNYFTEGDASYVLLSGEPITGLPQWNQLSTQDLHSISVNPRFADPTNNVFYPTSPAGRFNPVTGLYTTNDTEFSWMIDTGDPNFSYVDEPSPNGGRRNIGLYGGTPEASKSRSEPWLLAITAMAGGRAGGFFPLYWTYGNLDVTNRVHLDYSIDGGTNWYSIVSNLQINVDGYLWNSLGAVPFNQSPITKWRVILATDSNVVDETDRTFGLNGPFRFYINDSNTVGDVWSGAVGNDANIGIASNAPKYTLRAMLDTWDIDPQDFVYIDTGTYMVQSNDLATVRLNNRGEQGAPVTILGSPNGSVLDGSDIAEGESVSTLLTIAAPYIEVDNVSMRRGRIEATGTNIIIRNMDIEFGSINLAGQFGLLEQFTLTNGVVIASGPDMLVQSGYIRDGSLNLEGARATLLNTVVAGSVTPLVRVAGTNVTLINNTLVAGQTAVRQEGSDSRLILRNNILVANGGPGPAFAIERRGGAGSSDYNLFHMRNNAWYGSAKDGLWERLIYWQEKSEDDFNSISAEPLFANEEGGDFRMKSVAGRYDGGTWVTDAVHAASIDAGAPFDNFTGEPAPNGGRINIGAYGNTEQASRSRTTPWVYAMSMNDGGVIRGTNTLRWLVGGMDATNRVTLQYSANGGGSWIDIVTGLPALQGVYGWNTFTASNTLDALWRVVLEANPGISDQTDNIFNIRNDVRDFYVNNTSTNGDVFTTAPGSPANDGRTPATPKASLAGLLATYDTEPNDTIYVDTGIYTSALTQVIWSRGGLLGSNLVIRGSTNLAAGGSVLRHPTKGGDGLMVNASHVTVRDLVVENTMRGILLETNQHALVEEVIARSNLVGVAIIKGAQHVIKSSQIWNNDAGGVDASGSDQVTVQNVTFVNNTPFSANFSNTLNVVLQNNIFYHDTVSSNAQSAIFGDTGTIFTAFIDYNVYYFGSLARSNTTLYGNYTNLLRWQRERYKDFRSAITNPLFVSVASNDFHLQSQAGRYNPATRTFVNDADTSWAIDKGNPFVDYTREPAPNGGRINIGAFGNTYYASKGLTNPITFARTGNEVLLIAETENPYPLIWHVLNLPYDLTFTVQYSGDGGSEWTTLQSGVPAYAEYIVWTNSPTFNSFKGRWRVVGEGAGNTNNWDINDGQIRTFFGQHRLSSIVPAGQGHARIVWRGAWDEDYQIQFATNRIGTNRVHNWQNLGPITNLTVGGDIPFTDTDATNSRFRVYRVIWQGTNGLPYD